eukprot:TRINITY_DN7894_c1_g1_i1.p1 TRINITY_DN7894_c1_g1~~TRINITY_DN7894_c1_g1_i1.p1  ORF type:complete len:140 (-),score=26.55 TRINITY_DN7894_c1_g1_i1:306-686(-)
MASNINKHKPPNFVNLRKRMLIAKNNSVEREKKKRKLHDDRKKIRLVDLTQTLRERYQIEIPLKDGIIELYSTPSTHDENTEKQERIDNCKNDTEEIYQIPVNLSDNLKTAREIEAMYEGKNKRER